jgi:hypothetical protein
MKKIVISTIVLVNVLMSLELFKPKEIIKSNVIDKNLNNCEILLNKTEIEVYEKIFKYSKYINEIVIGKKLLENNKSLKSAFPIKRLYIEDILEPPLVTSNKKSNVLKNGRAFVKYENRYIIKNKARFRMSPKTWKDFLLTFKPSKYYETINKQIKIPVMKTTNKECKLELKKITKETFNIAFEDGKKEVEILFKERLNKLNKYMDDLYLYHYLFITKKIEPPVIGELITPIYDNKTKLTINESYYEIIKNAEFNTDTKKWKTFIFNSQDIGK